MSDIKAEDIATVAPMARVISHLNNPQNLLTYLVLTAWCKFMGVASVLPTISIG